jgi:hypothetical protein
MCECGCVLNDEHYTLPGPGKTFYVVTLSGHCESCDAPSGISIRLCQPGEFNHGYYSDLDNTQGALKFEKWGDGSLGAAIVCGLDKSSFVKMLQPHLVGIDSREIGDENGVIDNCGADVIAEEMYGDVQKRPTVILPQTPIRS